MLEVTPLLLRHSLGNFPCLNLHLLLCAGGFGRSYRPERLGRRPRSASLLGIAGDTPPPYSFNQRPTDNRKMRKAMSPMSLVRPNLYLGNFVNACNLPQLEALGISHIVNATAEVKNQFPNRFSYHRVPVKDLPSETLLPHFTPVSNFITAALEQGGKVLVHCQMGISRSATLMIAHLMLVETLELSVAYQEVRRVRQIICPIPAFLGHLRQLERELFGEVRTKEKLSFLDAGLVESEDSFEVLVVEY
jgi:protein-tyrosine phosphatase